MREHRTFAERARVLSSNEARRKYFLVYEGANTEVLYFEALNGRREEIGISPLIELVPIIRSYSEGGWSNPQKILERITENIDEEEKGYISYQTLLDRIMDYLCDKGLISTSRSQMDAVGKQLKWICQNKLGHRLEYDVEDLEKDCGEIIELLNNESDIENVSDDITDYIKSAGITYAVDFDKICLIVDRDRNSFTTKQYEYVIQKCKEKGYSFYVTNPCFEFWLLLHFDEVLELDRNKLLENNKVSQKRRCTEQELRKLFPEYTKSRYNADILIDRLDKAVKNEKHFCEDIAKLENMVGGNLGLFINDIKRYS